MLAVFAVASLALPGQVPACTALQRAAMDDDTAATQRLAGRRLLGIGPPKTELEARSDTPGACFRRTPLMLAAEHGSLASAKILITSGAAIDAVALLPELGDAALDARCLAIANGHAGLVRLLEDADAQTGACTDNALLFAALAAGQADLVEKQLRAHPSQQTLLAALKSAIGKRRGKATDLVVAALMATPKPDLEDAFTAAVEVGDAETIRQLVAGGARVRGGTQLAAAFASNQAALVDGLVAAGARTDDREVREAIVASIRDRRTAPLLALVGTGYRGDPDVAILTEAIQWTPAIVPKLVTAGVAVEVDDSHGTTPLMAAATAGDRALVALLLERGASPRTGNVDCHTAHDLMHPSLRDPAAVPAPANAAAVVPSRAARQRGLTCGEATFHLTYPAESFEVFLPGANVALASGAPARVDPGTLLLRVRARATGSETKVTAKLRAGMNAFVESFDPARPVPTLEPAPPVDVPHAPAAATPLELSYVLAVVQSHKADVAKCRRAAGGPPAAVVLSFRISAEGAATGLTPVPSNPAGTAYGRCLKEAMRTWKFPRERRTPEPFLIPFN